MTITDMDDIEPRVDELLAEVYATGFKDGFERRRGEEQVAYSLKLDKLRQREAALAIAERELARREAAVWASLAYVSPAMIAAENERDRAEQATQVEPSVSEGAAS